VPGSYRLEEARDATGGAVPFWARLVGDHRRIVVVAAPEAAIIPGAPGAQVVAGSRGYGMAKTEPAGLAVEIEARLGRTPRAPAAGGRRASGAEFVARLVEHVRWKGAVARELIRREAPRLVVVGFHETHDAGHRFCARSDERGRVSAEVRAVLRAIDSEIEEIVAALGDEPPNVFVLSNNGVRPGFRTEALTEAFCVDLGYQVRHPRAAHALLDRYRAIAPRRLRAAIERPLGLEAVQRWRALHFDRSWDWNATTAFALPTHYTGLIRVNLRGREPRGSVGRSDYPALLDRLEKDLAALRFADSGEPAVARVTRTARAFGTAPPELLPDLFVEWANLGEQGRRVVHPCARLIQRRPFWGRENLHTREGVAIAAGPSIGARGELPRVGPAELAPAFLALLGHGDAPEARRWTARA
jgi:predicted AlkP superfamily phosphohydrolase/phosphomutase